jgi:hypothetical protein
MYNEGPTAATEQVSQDHIEASLKLAHSGLSLEDIETVQQSIASDPMHRARMVQQLKTQDVQAPTLLEDSLPTFMYSYKNNSNHMHRTSLFTGEQSSHRVPSYTFEYGCYWSEVPGGSLLITGGVSEVVRIDTCREFSVAHCPRMLTPRSCHTAVYHTQHLFVL